MKAALFLSLFATALFSSQNCAENNSKTDSRQGAVGAAALELITIVPSEAFSNYWYAGEAEICTYDVTQERYGEIREAEQVNVFVTEDFSKIKQVKLDNPAGAGADRVPVLKYNSIRRFHTGIYDYSIMQSVFTPVSGLPTLKTTTTVQDWCGQIFIQNNLEQDGYHFQGFSYFEGEGDQDIRLPQVLLEDEIWTRVRLDPSKLTLGKVIVIPSAVYTRLRHASGMPQNADIYLEKGDQISILRLVYTDISRALSIQFETAFPHKILAWEETISNKIASKGRLKSSRKSAYWKEHANSNSPLRDSLKLHF
ncbi:MAG: septum formation inhibitor Maf [Saprospiraceae bacterium]